MSYKFLSTILGIDANFTGNVGVATTTPSYTLDVNGNLRAITSGIVGNAAAFGGGFGGLMSVRKDLDITAGGTYRNSQLAVGSTTNNGALLLGYSTTGIGSIQAAVMGVSYSSLSIQGFGGNLMVGTTTDAGYKLDVNGTGRVQTSITIGGASDGTLFFPNTTSGHQMRIYTQYASNAMVLFANGFNLNLNGAGSMTSNFCTTITGSNGSAALTVQQGNVAWTPVLVVNAIGSTGTRFNTNGNVLIGTTTDAGQKFQLAGNQATTLAGSGDGFTLTRTGTYDNVTLTALATITDTTSNANRAKTGLYVNVTSASTNIAIQTVGAVGVGVTPPSNSFASGYFSYLYAGATVNSAANYNLNVRSTISSFAAGNGGGMSFWGDDRGQAGANTAFAGIRGVKENGTYLNGLGALTFLTQASSAGLSTESTFAEVGRFTSGGNFLIGTTTNAGYKLDVNGTARVQGVITGSVNSGSLILGAASSNSQAITITGYFTGNGAISTANSNARTFNTNIGGQGYGFVTSYNGLAQGQTTTNIYYSATGNINLTDGAIDLNGFNFNPTIVSETGATIKAFSSGLNSASNHYNLYLSGTAQNYIAGNVGIGTSNLSAEANLFLGAKSTSEGGQLVLQKGTSQTYATHLDNYNNQFRVMVGTDTGSTAAQLIVMHATGNVLINSGTDNGYKFQVAGNVNVNTGSNTNNLVVNADTTMFYNLTSGGGQVQSNVYTTSVTTKYTANGSSSVALFEWDPTLCQGVFVDYVVLVDGINRLRSGTLVIVNDNGGNVTITDNINSSVNGSSSAVTFTTAGMASIRLYCNNGYAASDVFVNIVTRYIPNIY